jgi:hypothetical protein
MIERDMSKADYTPETYDIAFSVTGFNSDGCAPVGTPVGERLYSLYQDCQGSRGKT